jgi:DNA-binding response OmpR family regulator
VAHRLLQRPAQDRDPGRLVALELQVAERPGRVDQRHAAAGDDALLDRGPDHFAGSNIVDQQIRKLRARLQNDWRRPRFIAAVPGRGYRFLPTSRDDGTAALPA